MKCSCNVSPQVRSGKAIEEDGKVYWRQIFVCTNPSCPRCEEAIGERKVNVLDETDIVEKSYI